MNLWFHIIFGILAISFFGWQYKNFRKGYQLLFAVWVASSFLIYVSTNRIYQICLGVLELLLCLVSLVFLYLGKKKPSQPEEAFLNENSEKNKSGRTFCRWRKR